MIEILSRLFIKDRQNLTDPQVRKKYGMLCGAFGIFLNVILFLLKFTFGTAASSVAMVADAFNNLSDVASSIVSMLGFKLSCKKPDTEHPFGHGRLEYVSGLIVSFLIIIMGIELAQESARAIACPAKPDGGLFPVCVLTISILVKFYMYLYNLSISKKIDSVAMLATAKDSLSDMISTSVVLLSIAMSSATDIPIDGIAGLLVAIFIICTGIGSAKDTIKPLLGTPPSKEFVQEIETEVMQHKPICGIHDLVVHDYGPGRRMISLHAEVPGDLNIFELHDVIDNAEIAIAKKFNCGAVIHMDPIDTVNENLKEIKQQLLSIITTISPELKIHDIRIVPGKTHKNLIFDIVRPFNFSMTDAELKKTIQNKVSKLYTDIYCVITIDNPYC